MSKKEFYVYSTMTSAVRYPTYAKGGGDLPVEVGHVVIQGGANIPDKYMLAPNGAVITPVTAEELASLEASTVFQLHKKNGFITVSDKKTTGEKAAADMEGRDGSAPLVDADFIADGQEPPKMGKPEDDEDNKPKTSGRRA